MAKHEPAVLLKISLEAQDSALLEQLRGPQGDRGPAGSQGPAGKDSNVPGPKGDKGDKGDTGEMGLSVTGPQGPRGEKGEPGEAGKLPSKDELKALIREVLAGL